MFQNKIVVVTGGAQGIGKCIADEFRRQGAIVCVIDIQPGLMEFTRTFPARLTAIAWVSAAIPPLAAV